MSNANVPDVSLPEKLDLKSMDIAADRQAELIRLFPEVRTEGGKVDFDRLKAALGEIIDTGRERYGLTWPGKVECFRSIQAPSLGTLRPAHDESVNFDTTENVIIEGDNLQVLKLLQKSYLGKIKMIYIDPPYNTGNDFIYPDNYDENLKTYLQYTGQVDAEGRRFGSLTDADGRFHSKWLSMMYPRLYLARNLLKDDGILCVSVDDNEVANLSLLLTELFGDENHFGTLVWQKKDTPSNDAKGLSVTHDYIVIYQRSEMFERRLIPRTEDQLENYKNPDNDPRGPWIRTTLIRKEVREERCFALINPSGRERRPPPGTSWRLPADTFAEYAADNKIWWGSDADGDLPFLKRFLSEVKDGVVPISWWDYEFAGSNRNAKIEIRSVFGGEVPFDTPKPSLLIRRLLQISTDAHNADVVLDFFAGSGTTGHAVLDMNRADGGNRRAILVQLPEPTGRADYPTISDITKERIRRVIKNLNAEDEGKLDIEGHGKQDRGFRVFKLAESNLIAWDGGVSKDADALGKQLEMHIAHIREGRTDQDLLFELLLKSGFPLTTKFKIDTLAGKTVYSVADGVMLICLDRTLTLEVIRAMADLKPERVVCLDAGFENNDQLKANAVLTFRSKGVLKFMTV